MKTVSRAAVFVLVASAVITTLPAFAEGKILTDKSGMTVYTFDNDGAGKSKCNAGCATAWPPVSAESVAPSPDITTIVRDDGSKQAAYKNQPIYLYAADQKPGDKTGDGANNVWHIVPLSEQAKKPSAKPAAKESGSGY